MSMFCVVRKLRMGVNLSLASTTRPLVLKVAMVRWPLVPWKVMSRRSVGSASMYSYIMDALRCSGGKGGKSWLGGSYGRRDRGCAVRGQLAEACRIVQVAYMVSYS